MWLVISWQEISGHFALPYFFFYCGKIYLIIKVGILTILIVQFSGIQYILIVVQLLSPLSLELTTF